MTFGFPFVLNNDFRYRSLVLSAEHYRGWVTNESPAWKVKT